MIVECRDYCKTHRTAVAVVEEGALIAFHLDQFHVGDGKSRDRILAPSNIVLILPVTLLAIHDVLTNQMDGWM